MSDGSDSRMLSSALDPMALAVHEAASKGGTSPFSEQRKSPADLRGAPSYRSNGSSSFFFGCPAIKPSRNALRIRPRTA